MARGDGRGGPLCPPGDNPDRGGANEIDPVPTNLAFGPDGALYASLLTGGPFPPGASKVLRVTMDGKVSDVAPGLTMLTDVKHGPDGNWYVAQFAEFSFTSNPPWPRSRQRAGPARQSQ